MINSDPGIKRVIFNLNNTVKTMDSLTNKLSSGKKIETSKDDPVEWLKINNHRRSVSTLDSINTGLNSTALNVRIANDTMETIADYIEQMKSQLDTIYAANDNDERNDIIDCFNSFCSEIDSLTQPVHDDGARKIMADPLLVNEAGDITVIIGENGLERTIHSQEVHTGANGLDIPQLAYGATDDDINVAVDNLKLARDKLRRRQSSLATESASINRAIEYNSDFADARTTYAEESESADMLKIAVEFNSIEVQHMLTVELIGNLLENQEQLLALLR